MATRNKAFRTKPTVPDVYAEPCELFMWERYAWTEPPHWDEHPEDQEYRQAALPEEERVAEQIGPEYAGWNDDTLTYRIMWDERQRIAALELEYYQQR